MHMSNKKNQIDPDLHHFNVQVLQQIEHIFWSARYDFAFHEIIDVGFISFDCIYL